MEVLRSSKLVEKEDLRDPHSSNSEGFEIFKISRKGGFERSSNSVEKIYF